MLPCLNPDGAELYLNTPYLRTGGGIPNPAWHWKPGLTEEDVDGDGEIVKMRVEDPQRRLEGARASYVFHGISGLYYYDPLVLPAESLIEMITINATKAFGVEKETRSIEVGKKADLTIVDFNKPHLTPSFAVAAELTRYAYG